jgi:hypothetical protein
LKANSVAIIECQKSNKKEIKSAETTNSNIDPRLGRSKSKKNELIFMEIVKIETVAQHKIELDGSF